MPLNIKRPRATVAFYEDREIGQQVAAAEAPLEEAEAALAAVKKKLDGRLASKAVREAEARVEEAEARVEEARAAASATILDLTLEALPKKRWVEALAAHPPRPGDKVDANYLLNVDTFLAEVIGESVIEVRQRGTGEVRTDITKKDWADATADLDDGQYGSLLLAINSLNRTYADPF